jgi:hypothetical protein
MQVAISGALASSSKVPVAVGCFANTCDSGVGQDCHDEGIPALDHCPIIQRWAHCYTEWETSTRGAASAYRLPLPVRTMRMVRKMIAKSKSTDMFFK